MYAQQKSTIQKLLDENSQLILLMIDLLAKGKHNEYLEHQRTLHRNLTYLIQFDPSASHHLNNLPAPETFMQSDPTPSNILNSINKPVRSSYTIQQNTYGQYSASHPQQNYLVQQQWSNQSRASIQQQLPPHP